MRIALTLNTRRAESEFEVEYDPPHTIELIKHGILATGHEYIFIEADENFVENLKALEPDLVFNRAEGLKGDSRESHVPAMLEMLGIPPSKNPEVLSILEIDFSKFPEVGGVFGQLAKTVLDSLDHYICPAQIPENLRRLLERLSFDVWYSLDVKDFARIDFRMNDEGKLFFLEINPLPGMDLDTEENDLSFYPYMAMKSGYTYDELVRKLLESACARHGLRL